MTHPLDRAERVVNILLDRAIKAVMQYAEFTGLNPLEAPESYIVSHVFDHLPRSEAIGVLEVTYNSIYRWDHNATAAFSGPLPFDQIDQKRVDLVLFEPGDVLAEAPIWGLVEFNRGDGYWGDVLKLRPLLGGLKTVEFAAACDLFYPEEDPDWPDRAAKHAEQFGDKLIVSHRREQILVEGKNRTLQGFAWLMSRSSCQSYPEVLPPM
jgi:hypothetical protein